MQHKKKPFIIVGLMLGLLCGVSHIIIAYTIAPGLPGIFELCLLILIIGFWGAVGLDFGFIVYLITTLFLKNKKQIETGESKE